MIRLRNISRKFSSLKSSFKENINGLKAERNQIGIPEKPLDADLTSKLCYEF